MSRHICVHGHFYQPPRENPWLESIELQESAYPFHDWNERITAECYGPNAESRILDERGYIRRIVNNYARISFNMGPTLVSWMRAKAPDVLKRIVWADRESRERRGGHGNAMAQCYNHMIMPLANARDKRTQVAWSLRDFEWTFGRHPEGIWLPETAADNETLDVLAEYGIRFTVLAPRQAARVRRIGGGAHWKDVSGGRVDPSMPYLVKLTGGRSIAVFFYDGPISQAVAFEGLLNDGERFARRLESGFAAERTGGQLVHIATDGESYGHHHRYGDMALAFALDYIENHGLATLTNYGEFLEKFPPTHQAEIVENSSWSCAHGVERWRGDCGCGGMVPSGWSRQWRGALRLALDGLRDSIAPKYEQAARAYLRDPWEARDHYIDVALEHTAEAFDHFLAEHARRPLDETERIAARKLLEMQRQAMLMYTSCGWFFDELSGIETVQVIRYAARCIQLAEELFEARLEQPFLNKLALARSNVPEFRDGLRIYARLVRPTVVDLLKVGAHYAVLSLFEEMPAQTAIYAFKVEREGERRHESEAGRLVTGRARITASLTGESVVIGYGVVHLGGHELLAGVRELTGHENHASMVDEAAGLLEQGHGDAVQGLLRRFFGTSTYRLDSLFRDEQRRIAEIILKGTLAEVMGAYRRIYEKSAPLVAYLAELDFPIPEVLHKTAEFVYNANLRLAFENEDPDLDAARPLLEESRTWKLQLDGPGLTYLLTHRLEVLAARVEANHRDTVLLRRLADLVSFTRELPFQVDYSRAQNVIYSLRECVHPDAAVEAARGDDAAQAWLAAFLVAAEALRVRVG